MPTGIRILCLADSHLGFDLPARARVSRRRRGHDFLANYAAALAPALAGEVDLVVHGGDVFDRPGVLASVAYQAYAPLLRVAVAGVPVFVVPGNHERSRLPHASLAKHPLVRVFDRARTFTVQVRGMTVALSGFPFERRAVRSRFPELLESSGWRAEHASHRVLCMHQCVEGATVGPGNYTFRGAADVVRARDLPAGFSAVLSGHIHRHQVLTTDLTRGRLVAPVMYPGSIERTSLAEAGEPKGYLLVHLAEQRAGGDVRWEFRRLPVRPMIVRELRAGRPGPLSLVSDVHAAIAAAPQDAVLRIRILGPVTGSDLQALSAARLRAIAPETMNVEVRSENWPVQPRPAARSQHRRPREDRTSPAAGLLPLSWSGD
jgi:DNA repair exonuclease SbcCD nuclease subunit